MLKKLLKYDLQWCFKPLIVFYILAIFFAILTRIVETQFNIEQTLILLILDKICSGVVIAMLIKILINCFMRNWVRFVTNIYKDESYLTHTLPVSKSKLYLSKFLTAVITLFTSFVVIISCIAISTLNENTWSFLKDTLEQSAVFFNTSVFSIILAIVITIFFEFMSMLMSGILGIIIGHKSNNLKIVKSIIVGFVIYMTMSFCALGVIYISGLLNSDIMSLFNGVEPSSSGMITASIVAIIFYALYMLGAYAVGNRLLNKGVNVD